MPSCNPLSQPAFLLAASLGYRLARLRHSGSSQQKNQRLILSLPLVSDALVCGTTLSCSRHRLSRWSEIHSLLTLYHNRAHSVTRSYALTLLVYHIGAENRTDSHKVATQAVCSRPCKEDCW